MSAQRKAWNPRFIFYAASNGRTPELQLAHDRIEFPDGFMCGFLIWIGQEWSAYCAHFRTPRHAHSAFDHDQFDAVHAAALLPPDLRGCHAN